MSSVTTILPKQYKKKMDHMRFIELMDQGKINGYICQGYNPLASYPDKNKNLKCVT